MKKYIYIVKTLLVLALMFTGVANGQDRWELVSTDKQGSRYIDTQSVIMLSPGRYLFWEKFCPDGSKRQEFMESLKGKPNSDKFAYIIARFEVDCSIMKERLHSDTYYTEDGKVILDNFGKLSEWYDLPPGSAGETVLKRICTKGDDAKEM